MQNEDETLQLIHSLTGPEIRFFKLYTRLSGGDKKFTALFDFFKKLVRLRNVTRQKSESRSAAG